MMIKILASVALLIAILAPIAVFYVSRRNSDVLRKQLSQQNKQNQHLTQQLQILRSEIDEVRQGMLSVGQRVLQLEQLSTQIQEDQEVLKHETPESKLYSRAVKMIELGAELDEIINECEIPRAEAELLMSLHRKEI